MIGKKKQQQQGHSYVTESFYNLSFYNLSSIHFILPSDSLILDIFKSTALVDKTTTQVVPMA